jgi:DnaJ-class molecular chaperone
MNNRCTCVICFACHGTGRLAIESDVDGDLDVERCDTCDGDGFTEICDRCRDLEEAEETA